MIVKTIEVLGQCQDPTHQYDATHKRCVVEIDDCKLEGLIVSVSYEEELKNPEIWLIFYDVNYSLKIVLNEKIASRGQAERCDSMFPVNAGKDICKLCEPLFEKNNHKKYFAVDTWPKLFEKTIELVPPIKVADIYNG